ncbi:MAG: hypothetical protein NXI24_07085 [bacterium]|nr:hypothetical protein [bacterium]
MREARRVAETILNELPARETCVVVGCGWGYIAEQLLQLLSSRESARKTSQDTPRLLFFEPLASVSNALRSHGRLAELTQAGATILHEVEALREVLSAKAAIASQNAETDATAATAWITPAYRRLFPELEGLVSQWIGGANDAGRTDSAAAKSEPRTQAGQVDRATGGRFLRQWTRNALIRLRGDSKNQNAPFEFINPDGILKTETDAADPGEVLYCGAGPGLPVDLGLDPFVSNGATQTQTLQERRRERVQELRRNYFIVAADTALAPLLHAGLEPDLAISIDSGPGTYFHLVAAARVAGPGFSGFSFPVLTNLAGPRCLSLFFERRIYYRTSTPLDQWLALGPLGGIGELSNPTRNALGIALHIARLLGSKVLRTAGSDLQSAGRQTHVSGTGYTEYARLGVQRRFSLEMYQPGGYARRDGKQERTQKNELGFQSAVRMAADFAIDLSAPRPVAGAAEAKQSAVLDSAPASPGPREIPERALARISAAELRTFLQDTRPRLNEAVFADWQISRADLDRWFRILT